MTITTTVQNDIEVLCITAAGGLLGAKAAFEELEARLVSPRRRQFHGVFCRDGSYRVRAARRAGDDHQALGMRAWALPGSPYARARITDWPERVGEIGAAFERMADVHAEDVTRPSIEFYRSQNELVLLLPIAQPLKTST